MNLPGDEVAAMQKKITDAARLLRGKGLKATLRDTDQLRAEAISLWVKNPNPVTEVCWIKANLIDGLAHAGLKHPYWVRIQAGFNPNPTLEFTLHNPTTAEAKRWYALLLTNAALVQVFLRNIRGCYDMAKAADRYFYEVADRRLGYWQYINWLMLAHYADKNYRGQQRLESIRHYAEPALKRSKRMRNPRLQNYARYLIAQNATDPAIQPPFTAEDLYCFQEGTWTV